MPEIHPSLPYDPEQAIRVLKRNDRQMASLIARVGPCRLAPGRQMTPFSALLRAVVYQQLSGKAARSIHDRTLALFSYRRPTPGKVVQLGIDGLRSAGLSRAKAASILDLAGKAMAGVVPTSRALRRMQDQDIIETLTQVRGIGRWTVEMLLIFHLGRADVLPCGDLGVRKGLQRVCRMRQLPTPEQVLRRGERWRPYRSVASWYLWRANEL